MSVTETKFNKTHGFSTLLIGVLSAVYLVWTGAALTEITTVALINAFTVFVGAVLMRNVFRYFQPKATLAITPMTIILILSTSLTFVMDKFFTSLPFTLDFHLLPHNYWFRWALLFFILWVLFYEWWFLKNEERALQSLKRTLEIQEDLKNAEIRNIQQNVQPHFLFNSLNSISSLTLTNPEEAQSMVVKLSEFLRHSVLKNKDMYADVKSELDQINRYLDIEQIRFSHRLKFTLTHSPENDKIKMPSMVLQPLVENAIKHGLYGRVDQVDIFLNAERRGDYMIFTMTNPFDNKKKKSKGAGFGLSGLRKKLYLIYAENNLLTTNENEDKFVTELKIPIYDQDDNS
jgi:two-component system LytT family sensor kinase